MSRTIDEMRDMLIETAWDELQDTSEPDTDRLSILAEQHHEELTTLMLRDEHAAFAKCQELGYPDSIAHAIYRANLHLFDTDPSL